MGRRRKTRKSKALKLSLSDLIDFLKKVSLFENLSEEDLAHLAQDFQLKTFDKDEILFRQDDTSNDLYIIMKGKIRIYKLATTGGETSINIFSEHDPLGEFAAIDDNPRSATAKTIARTELLIMQKEKFYSHMQQIPELTIAMCKLLVTRIRWTAAFAESVAQYDARGRLLHMLLLYNEAYGIEQENGTYLLDLSLNQTDLASLIGTRREWVSHLLSEWSKRGLLEYNRGRIIFLDLEKVRKERDSRIEANVIDLKEQKSAT